ncbi:MAP3K12-binding inhibitory protein 1-like [Saccoglossus kowalevskii]|uniref:MAP3K12-binding inhibitory protein 1-like n=1 Tax=Saccoglossus kowalevskii TaxID=10224 RepID=A0ABM0H0Z3_SACKO|nr:PREDICTED: MAP3K12-binding inhibitory protein 1-like [Saccoglossus kowalevskii]
MAELLLSSRVLGSMQSFLRQSNLDKVCSFSINQEHLQTSITMLTSLNSLCGHVHDLVSNLQQIMNDVKMEVKIEQNQTGDMIDSKPDITKIDSSLVQINASKNEIERRISAFMERKQLEVNDNNKREFCGVIDLTEEDSCARTDAIFKARSGGKSHVKVSRVVNSYGPQTRMAISPVKIRPHNPASSFKNTAKTTEGVEERLHNMEKHLKLETGQPVPKDFYSRIKRLEDKILQLEGLSPEYFSAASTSYKRHRTESEHKDRRERQDMSIADIDQRMKELHESLLKKKQMRESLNTAAIT